MFKKCLYILMSRFNLAGTVTSSVSGRLMKIVIGKCKITTLKEETFAIS